MRLGAIVMLGTLALGGVAHAQPASAPAATKGYVEAVAQSAFGNVTSQSYGGEIGITVRPNLQVFVEGGRTRDVATAELSAAALIMAGALSQVSTGTAFTVKEPVSFGAAGVKWLVPMQGSKVQPYVMAGAGIASVKQDVKFTVNGTDVTSNMQQYGIVLGSDLSGSFSKPMVVLGAGATYPMWQQLVLDLQFRFGRVFAEDAGINVSRLGLGIGFRF